MKDYFSVESYRDDLSRNVETIAGVTSLRRDLVRAHLIGATRATIGFEQDPKLSLQRLKNLFAAYDQVMAP